MALTYRVIRTDNKWNT